MRYNPPAAGLVALLVAFVFAVVSDGYHIAGQKALLLKPSHRGRIINARSYSESPLSEDDEYDLPPAYDFDGLSSTTSSTDTSGLYPLPTGNSASESSTGYPSLTSDEPETTQVTEPRSPENSDIPEIESTSLVVIPESSIAPLPTVLPDTSLHASTAPDDASSPHATASDSTTSADKEHATADTVTVTVTNFISSVPSSADSASTSEASPVTNASPVTSVASDDQSNSFTVITLTSLHTITLSGASSLHNTTTVAPITSIIDTISPAHTISQNGTSTVAQSSVSTSAAASIITITRTETYTVGQNRTTLTDSTTSKHISTSTIGAPTMGSHSPPFPVSSNATASSTPVVSSLVSGAVTSLSISTQTVSQNITVTLGNATDTQSQPDSVPTYPAGTNTTVTTAMTATDTVIYPDPTTSTSNTSSTSISESTVSTEPSVIVSTQVVTVTVYPTAVDTATPTNETSILTSQTAQNTATVISPPYSAGNSSSSRFPQTGSITLSSSSPLTTGADDWGTTSSSASANSTVIGTVLNSTTTSTSPETGYPVPTPVETTCEDEQNSSSSATSTSISIHTAPGSGGVNVTSTYPTPTTFETTTVVSSSSATDESSASYPSPSGKKLPGSPNYPWGGTGPLHRLLERLV